MNAIARYLLVFLLGWSGAVFTYSDLIYPKKNPLPQKALNEESSKPSIQTNDVSPTNTLKLPTTASGRFIKSKKETKPPKQ